MRVRLDHQAQELELALLLVEPRVGELHGGNTVGLPVELLENASRRSTPR